MKAIIKIVPLSIVFTCSFSNAINAQNEANHWFTTRHYINFNNGHTICTESPIPAFQLVGHDLASIADRDGNLLFVTNLKTVFDRNFEAMPNGETGMTNGLGFGYGADPIIIPQPDSELYYLFLPNDTSSAFDYLIIDMSKNDGLGDVVQKVRNLSMTTYVTAATGNCDTFWLFITPSIPDKNKERNLLLRYKITSEGLDQVPDTVDINDFELLVEIKFSSNGKKAAFLTHFNDYSSGPYRIVVYDFDMEHGSFSNPVSIHESSSSVGFAFSPDNSIFYITEQNFFDTYFALHQFDISSNDLDSIQHSRIELFEGDEELFINKLFLTPDGQIFCEQSSTIGTAKSAIIRYPNKKGKACGFELHALEFSISGNSLNFVSTFLGENFDADFIVDAEEDQGVCTHIPINLGQETNFDIQYQWYPETFLSNPSVANPTFLYPDTISVKTDFEYILKGKKGYCYNSDTITITVHPDLDASVFGSKSVCPRVEEVDYWAKEDDRFRFEWSIDGGQLAVGQSTNSIKVNWGPTNADASVTVTPYNELNCPSPSIKFPVRINVELQTETPIGDELLCSNLAVGIPYHVTNTNGSVYTWESDFGSIISGQSTNKITVDWPGDGKYHLWVKEQSTTIDTVCYGVSDSLLVNLFTDSAKLEIDYVGVTHEDPGSYELQWFVSDTTRIIDDIQILTSTEMYPNWLLKDTRLKSDNYLSFPDTTMNYTPISFRISSVNGCQELIESEVHSTIFLEGVADSSNNSMKITWTPYLGWGNNIKQYEVWYSKDDDVQLSLVASMKPGENSWQNNWGAEAFDHRYRIRAIHSAYPFESWSNELTLSFNHSLEIPNVFTPNGDGINDSFDFPNLELYYENELQVYDRNGAEVFSKSDYDGGWTGGNLSAGVYYYSFTEKRNQKTYKGWVQILK